MAAKRTARNRAKERARRAAQRAPVRGRGRPRVYATPTEKFSVRLSRTHVEALDELVEELKQAPLPTKEEDKRPFNRSTVIQALVEGLMGAETALEGAGEKRRVSSLALYLKRCLEEGARIRLKKKEAKPSPRSAQVDERSTDVRGRTTAKGAQRDESSTTKVVPRRRREEEASEVAETPRADPHLQRIRKRLRDVISADFDIQGIAEGAEVPPEVVEYYLGGDTTTLGRPSRRNREALESYLADVEGYPSD